MYTHLVDLVIFKEQKCVRQLMRYVVIVRACNCSIDTSCSGLSLIVVFYHSIFIVNIVNYSSDFYDHHYYSFFF